MTTAYLSRALCCLLQPLQGEHASGAVTAKATAEPVSLPKRSIGIPIIRGQLFDDLAVKVEANPATTDGSWLIAVAGVDVQVTSIHGGVAVNLPAGTEIRWEEPPAGIEETGVVAAGGLAGGMQLSTFGALRQVRNYRDLGAKPAAADFFAGKVGSYPAAVLAWSATMPASGSSSPTLSSDLGRVGAGKQLYVHEWNLFLISSRLDGSDPRRREGDVLRDDVLEMLSDRQAYRGMPVSTPRGIQVLDARLLSTTPSTYVDLVRFATVFVLVRRDDRTFHLWNKTRLQMSLETSEGPLTVVDATDSMGD